MADQKFVFHPDMIVVDVLDQGDAVEEAFRSLDLKCPECVAMEKETMRDVARLYELDLDKLLADLAKKVGGKVVDTLPERSDDRA